jgi:hypothetical protein
MESEVGKTGIISGLLNFQFLFSGGFGQKVNGLDHYAA